MVRKSKRKHMIILLLLLLAAAAFLGYWKRLGIRNTIMRIAGIEVPRITKEYGFYKQVVKVDADVNRVADISENDAAADLYESNIPAQTSILAASAQIDEMLTEELAGGGYTFEEPLVVMDPFGLSPLTGLVLFSTEKEQAVRCSIRGKTPEADITYEIAPQTEHRIPLVGLYPAMNNSVTLELLDESGETAAEQVLDIAADGLPENMDGMVVPVKTCGDSAFGLTMVYGQKCLHPFAYDCNGDIRWYLARECANYGIYHLSNGNFILQASEAYTPSGEKPQSTHMYEMDYLGRAYRLYYLPHGNHHEVIEKEPGGNLLCLSSSMAQHFEDSIVEIDRESGLPVNTLNLLEIFRNTYTGVLDWAHINTVSYNAKDDTILISARNLNSVMKIGWTDHKLKWILADPMFWTKTKYRDYSRYVLKPEGDFIWHYSQHTSYMVNADLDQNPDTVEISLFDNHSQMQRKVSTFSDTGESYATVYSVNEKEGTVALLRQLPMLYSEICSYTLYDTDSGHLFGMCAIVNNPDLPGYRGLNYEFDYETGEILNQYAIRNKFYRATEAVIDYNGMAQPLDLPENCMAGQLPCPMPVKASVPEPAGELGEEVTLTRMGSVVYLRAPDHHISQVIFRGKDHTYVYDTTKIKLEFKRYLKYVSNMPIALNVMEPDEYQILCVYEDELYHLTVNGEPAYIRTA